LNEHYLQDYYGFAVVAVDKVLELIEHQIHHDQNLNQETKPNKTKGKKIEQEKKSENIENI
jgi:hypothetical protein